MFGLIPFRRRNNHESVDDFFHSIDDFFNDDFFAPMQRKFKADIRETKGAFKIDAELPGFEKSDIHLDYQNNYLTIRAKRNEETKVEEENILRQERHSGEFLRRFYLENVDETDIKATFNNGVLHIHLPKQNKSLNTTKHIEIE